MGVHVIGEQASELVHVGVVAMLAEGTAQLFNRSCFNFPTLGDLYKIATYNAYQKRDQTICAGAGLRGVNRSGAI